MLDMRNGLQRADQAAIEAPVSDPMLARAPLNAAEALVQSFYANAALARYVRSSAKPPQSPEAIAAAKAKAVEKRERRRQRNLRISRWHPNALRQLAKS